MLVPEVPALDAGPEHGPVVALRVGDQPRVLLHVETTVRIVVLGAQLRRSAADLHKLVDGLLLTRLPARDTGLVRVDLRVTPELVEAGVALPCPAGRVRIHSVQKGDD